MPTCTAERPKGTWYDTPAAQTGDLVACWAFVPHYCQPKIRQAHGQLWISSEESSPSPSSLSPHAVTNIQTDWGLAGVIEMLQGEHPASLTLERETLKNDRNGRGTKKRLLCLIQNYEFSNRKTPIMLITWHNDKHLVLTCIILTRQVYLPFSTFKVNSERGFLPVCR